MVSREKTCRGKVGNNKKEGDAERKREREREKEGETWKSI